MDHDRLVVARAGFPDGIKARIIGLDIAAVFVSQVQPEHLVDLQPGGAGAEVALKLGGVALRSARLVDAVKVHAGEMNDAVAEGLARQHVLVERLAKAAVHVADDADARLVHHLDHLLVVVGGSELAAMQMEVNGRVFGAGDAGPRKLHQRLGHRRRGRDQFLQSLAAAIRSLRDS